MRVLIVEDEPLAVEKLTRYLEKSSIDIDVLECCSSLTGAITFLLDRQKDIDLIFLDIQLQDGLSFEIFNRVDVFTPVIFITAFDEYAIDAFKVNSIDYLLKPINFTSLNRALNKFERLKTQFYNADRVLPVIQKLNEASYKSRFVVKMGNHIKSIKTLDISHFYAEGRDVYLVHKEGKKYIIEYKLEELERFIDPRQFFRINRSMIINISSIQDVAIHSNRRLKLLLKLDAKENTVVAREKVSSFRSWFEGE